MDHRSVFLGRKQGFFCLIIAPEEFCLEPLCRVWKVNYCQNAPPPSSLKSEPGRHGIKEYIQWAILSLRLTPWRGRSILGRHSPPIRPPAIYIRVADPDVVDPDFKFEEKPDPTVKKIWVRIRHSKNNPYTDPTLFRPYEIFFLLT